jgi:3-oxoadipate enol-lactonase
MAITPTKYVPVSGGVQLATFELGKGKPIVMINGLGASAHDWGPTAERLATRARVIIFDNRGAGQSTAPNVPFTLEQLADDTAAVFAAYGFESANLVGYSMGGMVAQLLAARRPKLIERLVLMATHAGAQSAIPAAPTALAAFVPDPSLSREQLTRRNYALFVAPQFLEHNRDMFERMMTVRLANLIPLHAFQLLAISQSERAALVRTICVPTLIVHGRLDPLVPFGNGEILCDLIPGAHFVAIEGSGHMLNWEKPEATVAAIGEFFGV